MTESVILPPAVIGIFGSGQLGRMLACSAREMGYRVHTFSPEADSPTGHIADSEVTAPYDDSDAVRGFVSEVDVVTFEFENVTSVVAEIASAEGVPVRPGGWVLHTTQNRLREKTFLSRAGLPVTPFVAVRAYTELEVALSEVGCPAILKTSAFGYDGKGQARIDDPGDAAAVWRAIGGQESVLEAHVPFQREVSVVGARGTDGSFVHYAVIENVHRNHILDLSMAPARVSPAVWRRASEIAREVFEVLDVVGVLCVELFVTAEEELLINELAPRPHNSAHLTVDAALVSQFDQQLRAVCGLPLGSTELLRPAAMVNLLGDMWQPGIPDWQAALKDPEVKLHLYGKRAARPGRKMGHLTVLADDVEVARRKAVEARRVASRLREGESSIGWVRR
jgi:5-(carboxyamino)imidazole ribonucleotide synthase